MIFQTHPHGKLQLQISTGHPLKINVQQFVVVSNLNLTWLGHKLWHFTTHSLKCHLPMAVVKSLSLLPSYILPKSVPSLGLQICINPFHLSIAIRISHSHIKPRCPKVNLSSLQHKSAPTSTPGISTSGTGVTMHKLILLTPPTSSVPTSN